MELLQTIEKHCSWFPSPSTLDLGTWEKVGSKLEKLLCEGVPLSISIWSVLDTDKINFFFSFFLFLFFLFFYFFCFFFNFILFLNFT